MSRMTSNATAGLPIATLPQYLAKKNKDSGKSSRRRGRAYIESLAEFPNLAGDEGEHKEASDSKASVQIGTLCSFTHFR